MKRSKLAGRSGLLAAQLDRLDQISAGLCAAADLFGADIFIDCREKESGRMFVARQFSPKLTLSAYEENAVGKFALPEDEPAVYHAMEKGVPVRDFKARTQENRTVRQDVLPLRDEAGTVIAVLISERDVSRDVSREKKYRELVRRAEDAPAAAPKAPDAALREIHHRVKNNLQMVASIMNLQARQTKNEEVRRAFRENTARVLSIAAIHDLLTRADNAPVVLGELFEKLARNLQSLSDAASPVRILVEGDRVLVDPDRATHIALVVNELVSNSLKHGFAPGKGGEVHIITQAGSGFCTVTVKDNGTGFELSGARPESLGLSIVNVTVKDKLGGELRVSSGENGTAATFDFSTES